MIGPIARGCFHDTQLLSVLFCLGNSNFDDLGISSPENLSQGLFPSPGLLLVVTLVSEFVDLVLQQCFLDIVLHDVHQAIFFF